MINFNYFLRWWITGANRQHTTEFNDNDNYLYVNAMLIRRLSRFREILGDMSYKCVVL